MSGRSISRRSRALACAAALLLSAAGTSAAHAETTTTPVSPAFKTPRLYVVNQSDGILTGVDASTGAVRTVADLNQPRGVGAFPLQMRTSHNGHIIYALCDGTNFSQYLSGTLIAIDAFTDKVIGTAPIGFNANNFVISPDGRYAYVSGIRNIYKVNLDTMRVVQKLSDPNLAYAPQLSPDGKKLYVVDAVGKDLLTIDTKTLTVKTTTVVGSNLLGTDLSHDGTELYIVNSTRRLTVLNTATYAVVATIAVGPNMSQLDMSPDGSKIYVSGNLAREIDVVKTSTNKFNRKIALVTFDGVQFSPDGGSAYAVSAGPHNTSKIYMLDVASGALRSTVVVNGQYDTTAVSPDGTQLWVFGYNGTIVVDPKTDKLITKVSSAYARAVGFDGSSRHAFVGEVDTNTVHVFSTSSLKQQVIIPCEFRFPESVTVTPNGATAYVTSGIGSTVREVDLLAGKPTADISAGNGPNAIAATPDGAHVLVANYYSDDLSVIATATDKVVGLVPVKSNAIELRVSPDGSTAYVLTSKGLVYVDLATFKVTQTVPLSTFDEYYTLALSPDGSTAYLGGDLITSGSVAVVDLATGTIARTLTAGTEYNSGMALSPDNKTLYIVAAGASFSQPGDFYEVNLATGTTSKGLPVGLSPTGVVLSTDGSTAYVDNGQANTVSVVDTATDTVTHTWTFGKGNLGSSRDGIFYSND